jgi:hypothetical protein
MANTNYIAACALFLPPALTTGPPPLVVSRAATVMRSQWF